MPRNPQTNDLTKRSLTYSLPQLPDGRTYVTHKMMDDEPSLRHFINRTRGAWQHLPSRAMYVTIELEMRIAPTTRINYFNETIVEEGKDDGIRTAERHTQEEDD
jgi:hypothetical protein